MAKKSREPFSCPACGEDVPAGAKSCPECGACDKSGWSTEADDGGLGLPDEDFDYDKFVDEEFGSGMKKSGVKRIWLIVAALLIAFAMWAYSHAWFPW